MTTTILRGRGALDHTAWQDPRWTHDQECSVDHPCARCERPWRDRQGDQAQARRIRALIHLRRLTASSPLPDDTPAPF